MVYAFDTSAGDSQAEAEHARLGVSVGRRVGGAVARNTVKRQLREAFWSLEPALPGDHDFVVVARAGAAEIAEREGLSGVQRELVELLGRLGWTVGGGGEAAA